MDRKAFRLDEMDRLLVIKQVELRQISQVEAGVQLGLSQRQVRRLLKRVKIQGAEGILSQHKGGNRAFGDDFKQKVLAVVKTRYWDFGPTLAAEKLWEYEGLRVNKETLRGWMIQAELWKGRKRKAASIHQSRERRDCFGELVQIDGSHHDWFEGRGPECCLLVFIDDARSYIVSMRFEESETTMGYMRCSYDHITHYGRPVSYYSDKHSIFRTIRKDGIYEDTQLYRALRQLNITLICADSSQAKGRVERANQTLQDRLIKEMRLRGISSIEEANAYLPTFIKAYNQKFAVNPKNPQDAHRDVLKSSEELQRILSIQTPRKVTKNLELSHKRVIYQIIRPGSGYRYRHATVLVCEQMDGSIALTYGQETLAYKTYEPAQKGPEIVDTKELNPFLNHLIKNPAVPSLKTGHF